MFFLRGSGKTEGRGRKAESEPGRETGQGSEGEGEGERQRGRREGRIGKMRVWSLTPCRTMRYRRKVNKSAI